MAGFTWPQMAGFGWPPRIEVLRRASGTHRDPEQHWLREVFRPRVVMDILDRHPHAGAQLLRLLRERHNNKMLHELGNELVERVVRAKSIPSLLGRSPEVTAELLLLLREMKIRDRLPEIDEEWLHRSIRPEEIADLLAPNSSASISVLDLALEIGSDRWLSDFCEQLLERLRSAEITHQSILSDVPLRLIYRLRLAAERSGNTEVLQYITATLEGTKDESFWHDGRLPFRRPIH